MFNLFKRKPDSHIARIEELEKVVAHLQRENAELKKENAELKARLKKYEKPPMKNSNNSSIPPSQDQKRYPKKGKSDRQRGGQEGHPGYYHPLSEHPTEVEALYPESCAHCGSPELEPLADYREVRQEVDLPELKHCITEYRQHLSRCRHCGKTSRGTFPFHLQAPVQMGPQAKSLVGYLKVVHHLSHQRIEQAFGDLFGISVSSGWINTQLQCTAKRLAPQYEAMQEALRQSDVLGSDETGNWVNGKRGYVFVFQTPQLCLFFSSPWRSFQVIERILGEAAPFSGTWVSDRYGAQLKVPAQHQLCLVHLIRDCRYLIEAQNSAWAQNLKTLFQETMAFRRAHGQHYNPACVNTFRHILQFENRLSQLFEKPPPEALERTLFNSLRGRQHQLLVFLRNPQVPYDNNASERALRSRVVHRKVSGGFRGFIGSRCHDIIASFVETAKRQNLDILDVLSGKSQPLLTS